jgi:DNA-binding transcriptional ArsR family regulator
MNSVKFINNMGTFLGTLNRLSGDAGSSQGPVADLEPVKKQLVTLLQTHEISENQFAEFGLPKSFVEQAMQSLVDLGLVEAHGEIGDRVFSLSDYARKAFAYITVA